MAEIISRVIDNDEVLVRFLFRGDFKRNKPITLNFLIKKEVFLDTRGNEVSLLRERYNNEQECERRGLEIKEDLVGFAIFKKQAFIEAVESYQNSIVEYFKADVISSPLDEEIKVIPETIEVTTDTPISPGHSDLIYINPGIIYDGESTNVAVRRFSEFLFNKCKVLLLSEIEGQKFVEQFDKAI